MQVIITNITDCKKNSFFHCDFMWFFYHDLDPWARVRGADARREGIWLSWCDIKEFPTQQMRRVRSSPSRAAEWSWKHHRIFNLRR